MRASVFIPYSVAQINTISKKKIVSLPSNFLFVRHSSLIVSDSQDLLNFLFDEATAPSYFTNFSYFLSRCDVGRAAVSSDHNGF